MGRMVLISLGLAVVGCGDDSGPGPGDGAIDRGADTTGDTTDDRSTDRPGDLIADQRPDQPADSRPDTPSDIPPEVCAPPVIPALAVENIAGATTFRSPIFVTQAPGSTDTLWVVEQRGTIQLVTGGLVAGTFLDITSRVVAGGEQGLLGLAFHPDYAANGRYFVYYTNDGDGANIVAEYNRDTGNTEGPRLLNIPDTEGNHNGGMIAFGPDRLLYVGTGDGGGGGDPEGDAQSLDRLFGKMLRLDVDAASPFAAAGNPFAAGGGDARIWAYGLRNPWRWSFDRLTGDLYIGDVGQNCFEEIDVQPAASRGGENYGWNLCEGTYRYRGFCEDPPVVCASSQVGPVLAYPRSGPPDSLSGRSVTGGYVYRGTAIPALQGAYIFADFYGAAWALRWCEGTAMGPVRVTGLDGLNQVASFGDDQAGELYVVSLGGRIVRIIPG